MSKSRILFIVLVVILVIGGGSFCWENRENRILRSQVRDLEVQLAQSSQKVDTFLIRDSVPVWMERIVEVDRTDYKKQLADRELIKDLKLRIGQLESENNTLIATRDTVILTPKNDSLLTYGDKWVSFSFDMGTRVLDWEVRDSLTTYVAREYRHRILWGLIKWGTKGYDVYIVSHNPKCKVEYDKYIRIK